MAISLYQQWKTKHGGFGERALQESLPITDPFIPVLQKEQGVSLYQQWKAKRGLLDTVPAEAEATGVPPTTEGTLRSWERGLFGKAKQEVKEIAGAGAADIDEIVSSLPALALILKDIAPTPITPEEFEQNKRLGMVLLEAGKIELKEYRKLLKHPLREFKAHPVHTLLRLLPIKFGLGFAARAAGKPVAKAVSKVPFLKKGLLRPFSDDPAVRDVFRSHRGQINLGELEAKRVAESLHKGLSAAERLRAGQIIKGSTTELPEFKAITAPVKKTRDWLAGELRKRKLLGEETFLTKLPKKRVAELNRQKVALEKEIGRLEKHSQYPGRAKQIGAAREKIKDINTHLKFHYHRGGELGRFPLEYMPREYMKHLENKQKILHFLNPKKYSIKTPWKKGRKDIPEEVRIAMGEVLEPAHPMYLGITQESRAIAAYDLFQEIAKNPKWAWSAETAAGAKPEGWIQISKTEKLKSLGDLSGKYVRPDIAEVITRMGMSDVKAIALYKKSMAVWKMGKILPRAGTHMRNMYNNVVFLDFAGLSPLNPKTYAWLFKAGKEIKNKGPLYKEMLKSGLIETEFYGQEMLPLMQKYLQSGKKANLFDDVADAVKGSVNKLGQLYQAEDQMFKIAIYMKHRADGMAKADALNLVDRFMPNYAEVPGITRLARQTVIPFASFKSEAFRIFKNAAQDQPLKLAYWMALPGLITDMSAKTMGLSDKQVDKLEKNMPDYAKSGLYALVPSDPKHPKWWDASYVFFWNDLVETSEGKGLLAHPLLGIAYALQRQVQKGQAEEVFTGKTITTPGRSMPLSEKFTNWANYLWKTATPATPTPGAPDYQKIKRAVTKEKHPWTGEIPSKTLTALDVLGGIRVKGFGTPEQMEESKLIGQSVEGGAIKKRIRRLQRLIERGFLSKEKEKEYEEKIEWLEEQLEAVGEEMEE